MTTYSLRNRAGALLYDWPRFSRHCKSGRRTAGGRGGWVAIRNRRERIEWSGDGEGARCDWVWTSDLHIANVFPSTGRRLLGVTLADWPIRFADAPLNHGEDVDVSFLIGHRGKARLPHLQATLRSIAAQEGVSIECIVVEQSDTQEVEQLPPWVRYQRTPLPRPDLPYCRSWALNVGARLAKGRLIVLHDNDMLVPAAYASELVRRFRGGAEIIDLKRFTFYLSEADSNEAFRQPALATPRSMTVVQNLQGASIAAGRDAFFAIGGFDESFIGWGGEDNDFWDRARTRSVFDFGYLPFVHLWHASQPEKAEGSKAPAVMRYSELAPIDPQTRIARLCDRGFGRIDAPSPDAGARSENGP
ncbi:MAG TPA: galactosyltransferase-related protein [Thermoanaerobaculia bacterium]|nr:galactosyltransferase-related protein [Thermoanaerobaculia bacterium]